MKKSNGRYIKLLILVIFEILVFPHTLKDINNDIYSIFNTKIV